MRFMNYYEIDTACERFAADPVLGPASETLRNLRDCADSNSDGWAYWPKPARAAASLMTLIETGAAVSRGDHARRAPTAADVRKAYGPIRAFLTRTGLACEIVAPR